LPTFYFAEIPEKKSLEEPFGRARSPAYGDVSTSPDETLCSDRSFPFHGSFKELSKEALQQTETSVAKRLDFGEKSG